MTLDTYDQSPNVYDVAEVAGVSHQTVSRVVNAPETARPTTRTRVLAVIGYLGNERDPEAARLGRLSKPRRRGTIDGEHISWNLPV